MKSFDSILQSGLGQQLRPMLQLVYGLAASIVGLFLFREAVLQIRSALTSTPWDFMVDLRLARAFIANFNPYTPEGAHRALLDYVPSALGHPPSTAFWALPLAHLEDHAANSVLGWLSAALVLMQVSSMVRELKWPVPLPSAWLIFALIVSSEFFSYHVSVGQLSVAIGFFFFLAWIGIRTDNDWLAGIALGAACSMKPFPGVVVMQFLVRKRNRVVGTAVAVYLAISAYMTTRFGFSSWPLFLEKQKIIADIWLDSIQNQSLHGIITHFFQPTCGPHGPVVRTATIISSLIGLSMIGAGAWLAWKMPATQRNRELTLAGFTVLAVFTSQWSWEHYNVILFVPFAILATQLVEMWKAREGSRPLVALGACGVAFAAYAAFIPLATKSNLQRLVRAGNESVHFKLHLYEALNSAPLVLLLLVSFSVIATRALSHSKRTQTAAAEAPATFEADEPAPQALGD